PNVNMDRLTILKPTGCDVKQLPLKAVEAFVLSQIDGRLTLDEIAEIAGLDFDDAVALARRLLEMGAASASGKDASDPLKRRKQVLIVEENVRGSRSDPRAESMSVRPDPRVERMSARPDARVEKPKTPSRAIRAVNTPRAETRRPSRKSLRVQRAAI